MFWPFCDKDVRAATVMNEEEAKKELHSWPQPRGEPLTLFAYYSDTKKEDKASGRVMKTATLHFISLAASEASNAAVSYSALVETEQEMPKTIEAKLRKTWLDNSASSFSSAFSHRASCTNYTN